MLFKNKVDYRLLVVLLFSLTMVSFALAGGYLAYSPIPKWDMWSGTVDFIRKVQEGSFFAWWEQHNEHRIVLARILFWMDFSLFNGMGWFLVLVNYLLLGIAVWIFWKYIYIICGGGGVNNSVLIILLLIIGWLFQWMQQENMTWGFQSQFILAQLIPLIAFYWLWKAYSEPEKVGNFLAACILGICSVGTMANGILTLPLMTAYALIGKFKVSRIVILFILSVALISIYFYEYHAPVYHGSLTKAIIDNPLGLLQYVLLYIGCPFYYLFGMGDGGRVVALCSGFILIVACGVISVGLLKNKKYSMLSLALLTYILYIGGTALGTAGGRLVFGVDQALSSRYTTPALFAWAGLFILVVPFLMRVLSGKRSVIVYIGGIFVIIVMLVNQLPALKSQEGINNRLYLAALALELGVNDDNVLSVLFPKISSLKEIANQAYTKKLSIFGNYPFRGSRENISKVVVGGASGICTGSIDQVEGITTDLYFVRVSGHIKNMADRSYRRRIQFLDINNHIVGYALTQRPRKSGEAFKSRFEGYLFVSQLGQEVAITGDNPLCRFVVNVPDLPYISIMESPQKGKNLVDLDSVLEGNQWQGSDSQRSHFHGLSVVGSYIDSDADTGLIKFNARKGAYIYYRTGPVTEKQFLQINDSPSYQLAQTLEWSRLVFSGKDLPDNFIVKISDQGNGWGEWSAIALDNAKVGN